MTEILWEDRYAVGHESIDAQHRRLFVQLAEAAKLFTGRLAKGDARGAATIDHLLRELRDHFRFENEIMRTRGYPQADSHRQYHAQMLTAYETATERLLAGADGSAHFADFLKQWYYHHTSGADINLGKWLSLNP
ncbi:MAG: hemerythrin domain-containing protein [Planctomycetes bacterium]|nr:hemerythrin domain-containing protein [Planctomycetota bacterium]